MSFYDGIFASDAPSVHLLSTHKQTSPTIVEILEVKGQGQQCQSLNKNIVFLAVMI